MADEEKKFATKEITNTLQICNLCIGSIGISLVDDVPTSFRGKLKTYTFLVVTTTFLILIVVGEYAYIIGQMMKSELIEDLIGSNLHIAGYGFMIISTCGISINILGLLASYSSGGCLKIPGSGPTAGACLLASGFMALAVTSPKFKAPRLVVDTRSQRCMRGFGKLMTIWYKRSTFRQLVRELADIWPVHIKDQEAAAIKRNSLSALKLRQILYTFWNVMGVILYNLTPILILVYHRARGAPAQLGYVWQLAYPFDKTKPVYHELVYVFETCAVCNMLGSDLLFMTMASHISMLLRILQVQIRNILSTDDNDDDCGEGGRNEGWNYDCYDKIVAIVKIHQRLIHYINDLEDAFSLVNLINVLLSSVNICCVVFTIVFLEPWIEMSNKCFLGAALTQMGIVCWYADDIYRASTGVADAVYESGWYKTNAQCRRALLLVLKRSQKPLYFTALKFRDITMTTYSSILTTAYSYFTLLYTSYNED